MKQLATLSGWMAMLRVHGTSQRENKTDFMIGTGETL